MLEYNEVAMVHLILPSAKISYVWAVLSQVGTAMSSVQLQYKNLKHLHVI